MQGFFVGVDVSQESYVARMEDENGRLLGQAQFANSHAGAQECVEWIHALRGRRRRAVWVATEGVGGYVAPLDKCLMSDPRLHYAPLSSTATDRHRCHFSEDVTDASDAAVIVDLLRQLVRTSKVRECAQWTEWHEGLRQCARTFEQLGVEKTRILNQLRSLCEQLVPDYLRAEELPALHSATFLALLVWCPDPRELADKTLKEVAGFLRTASRGHHRRKTASRFQELARGMKPLGECLQTCVRNLVAVLQTLQTALKEMERTLDELLEKSPLARELRSWKGVGLRTVAGFLGEAGDLRRFDRESTLARISGVAPVRSQSGKRDKQWRGVRYNRRMKRALWLMATSRIENDPESRDYYQRKLKETQSRGRSVKGLARHLLRRIYTTWQQMAGDQVQAFY